MLEFAIANDRDFVLRTSAFPNVPGKRVAVFINLINLRWCPLEYRAVAVLCTNEL